MTRGSAWYQRTQEVKRRPNDELYTPAEAVRKELDAWPGKFSGKSVYCPCDDYRFSAFWSVLYEDFHRLGLRRLTATGYNRRGRGVIAEYDGAKLTTGELIGDGDFRSGECLEILRRADVVFTNPPFSLIGEFYQFVRGKTFCFLAPITLWHKPACRREVCRGEFRPGNKHTVFYSDKKHTKKKGVFCFWAQNLGPSPVVDLPTDDPGEEPRNIPPFDDVWMVNSMSAFPVESHDILACPCTAIRYLDPGLYDYLGRANDCIERGTELRKAWDRFFFRKKRVWRPYSKDTLVLGAWSPTLWRRFRKAAGGDKKRFCAAIGDTIRFMPVPTEAVGNVRLELSYVVMCGLKYSDVQRGYCGIEGDLVYWNDDAGDQTKETARRWLVESVYPAVEKALIKHFGDTKKLFV